MWKAGFIFAVTPNPALDLGGVVEGIKPNEKSYVYDETRSPGGNAINAARILHRLGIPVRVSGFLGGAIGDEILELLRDEGLDCDFVAIRESSRIGVTVSNRRDHRQTRLTFPGPRLGPKERNELFAKARRAKDLRILLLGGSFPAGFGVAAAKKLLREASERQVPSLLDCPAKLMRDLLSARPFMIKPNLTEFQELTGTRSRSLSAICEQAHRLTDRVRYVCVSSVENGALLVTRTHAYYGRSPRVRIRSTVGAGDSMVGAMAARIFQDERSDAELLRWGLAAAASTLSHVGTELGRARQIRALHARTRVHLFRLF